MAPPTFDPTVPISGHVYLREGKRRSTWYAKWRDLSGQHQKRLGPAWTAKGPPTPGLLRQRDAQALLDELLVEARRGVRRQERTGVTFADVAEEWFERGRFERDWSASTQVDYRSVLDAHLLKEFGTERIETITSHVVLPRLTGRDGFHDVPVLGDDAVGDPVEVIERGRFSPETVPSAMASARLPWPSRRLRPRRPR